MPTDGQRTGTPPSRWSLPCSELDRLAARPQLDGDREATLAAVERFAEAVRGVLKHGPPPDTAARDADAATRQMARQ
jgi:hypothetical protein